LNVFETFLRTCAANWQAEVEKGSNFALLDREINDSHQAFQQHAKRVESSMLLLLFVQIVNQIGFGQCNNHFFPHPSTHPFNRNGYNFLSDKVFTLVTNFIRILFSDQRKMENWI